MLTTIVVVMAIYFAVMILISWMGKKHATNFSDYLSAGKSAGIVMIIGGSMGAHIGNGLVVGGGAEGASLGLGGAAYGIGCCISYLVVAALMSRFVYKRGYLSLAEFLRERYHSELPSQIYNIATTCSYVGLIGGQLMAGGALFEALGMNRLLGIIVIAVIVFLYSQISGLWGAFATSVVQSAVILVGLFAAGAYLISDGAWLQIQSAVTAGEAPAYYTSMWGAYTPAALVGLMVPVSLMVITDQCTYQRISSAKTLAASTWGHILSAFLMVPVCILPVIIGMYGHVRFGASGNSAFFTVILNILPPLVGALVVTAVIAAVMSTIDAAFIAFSQVLLNDLYKNHINKKVTDQQLSKMTLGLNVTVTVIGVVFAMTANSLVGLLSNCYLFMEAACLVPFLGGRWFKKATKQGAIAASIVGCLIAVLQMFGIYALPYAALTMFIPSLIVFIVVSLMTQKDAEPQAEALQEEPAVAAVVAEEAVLTGAKANAEVE